LLEQKLLTWDNLVKRGFLGPSMCALCGVEGENAKHLFVDCVFTKDIWLNILKQIKCTYIWEGRQVNDCYLNWIKKRKILKNFQVLSTGRFGNKGIK
jgi:hypothetical protein